MKPLHLALIQLPPPLPFHFNHLTLLLLGGVCAFLLSYLFTFGVLALCRKAGWLDRSTADRERIHKVPVPRLGGVAIFLAFLVASLVFYTTNPELGKAEFVRYILLLVAATLIVIVHAVDDVRGLKPWAKLLAQTIAVIIVLGPSFVDWQFHGIFLFGFNNPLPFRHPTSDTGLPWYDQPELTIFINSTAIQWLALPAVAFTWFWMAGMMNTINFIDGVDGLATGVVGFAALFVTIISWMLQQYTIAVLAGIFTGAVFGFLPHNWNPAKIFMGDSGSQFLGLGLAALSILGGAKLALALMVLGVPILDLAVVVVHRLRHGQSPTHHDTSSHLHYRLMATGLNARQICYVFYGLTILFGVLALNIERVYKIFGIGLVGLVMVVLVIWLDHRQVKRNGFVKLDQRARRLERRRRGEKAVTSPLAADPKSEESFQLNGSMPDPAHSATEHAPQ